MSVGAVDSGGMIDAEELDRIFDKGSEDVDQCFDTENLRYPGEHCGTSRPSGRTDGGVRAVRWVGRRHADCRRRRRCQWSYIAWSHRKTGGSLTAFETQAVEWKSSWRDEYLKWICGFANAQGGVLEIGKDDDGQLVGAADARSLLTEIPNKVTSTMAIIVDVDLNTEDGLQYLVITVNPYPSPISYHGKYYYRSGATTRELTGDTLDEFMLRKEGKTWDGVPVPRVGVPALDLVAFRDFRRKAISSDRLTAGDLGISDAELIDSLRLPEGNNLKRAAILLFHEDPERWFTGAYVKIGYFQTGADLLFTDEVHGLLISMADKVLDILYDKYFKGMLSYRGVQPIETFPWPRPPSGRR